jgi:hypothetical protein
MEDGVDQDDSILVAEDRTSTGLINLVVSPEVSKLVVTILIGLPNVVSIGCDWTRNFELVPKGLQFIVLISKSIDFG